MVRIFIVEDESSIQYFYKQILTFHGYDIAGIATNGEEAISMFKAFVVKPEIVLMDHRMPHKNGIETSKELLLIDNNLKIIFLSADDSIEDEALKIGVSSFSVKPITIQGLLSDVKKAILGKNLSSK